MHSPLPVPPHPKLLNEELRHRHVRITEHYVLSHLRFRRTTTQPVLPGLWH